jgi:uncharacterized protein YbjT (DUF2867 family)
LLADDVDIRAISRKPDNAGLPEQVEVRFGDLDQPDSILEAARDVDAAFLMNAGAEARGLRALVDAGVRRIVYMSALTVQSRPGYLIGVGQEANERALKSLDVEWTILQPGQFASNTFWWRDMITSGTVFAPFPDIATPIIDPYDIAAVARVVLLAPDAKHAGATYLMTGPELITTRQRVATLADVLGRRIEFVPVDRATALEQMSGGIPNRYAEAALDLIGAPNADEMLIHPTVEEVTGRPARTFADWVAANRAAFA